jgi:2-polyprenyl-6-methoxyphenol hydroxylase-like FAD-dependent oxidoreductase
MHKDYVSLRSNSTVTAISEDKDWVYVEYTDKEGQTCKLRSMFLVGADGKTGFTRKKYLEPKGITMERDPK